MVNSGNRQKMYWVKSRPIASVVDRQLVTTGLLLTQYFVYFWYIASIDHILSRVRYSAKIDRYSRVRRLRVLLSRTYFFIVESVRTRELQKQTAKVVLRGGTGMFGRA